MASLSGYSWGSTTTTNGDAGGVVSWSIAPAGLSTSVFPSGPGTSVDPNSIFNFDYVALIDQAFDTWSQYGNIEFIEMPDAGGAAGQGSVADIRIFFGSVPGSTLGLAYFPTGPSNSAAGDIILDIDGKLANDPNKFYQLVLHEIGHSLGLDHEDSGVATVMTSVLSTGTLQQDDINGIRVIYGAQDNAAWSYNMAGGQANFTVTNSSPGLGVNGNGLNNAITGSDGAERFNGNDGSDTIRAGLGEDTLNGNDGADRLFGGDGDDNLNGGAGTDILYGEAGDDTLNAGDEADRLYGGTGDDLLMGGWSEGVSVDGLWGDAGDDTLYGELGHDFLDGGIGNDLLDGGDQADNLYGGAGDDILRGGQGLDRLFGGDGKDFLRGGTEDDGLFGGSGDDMLNGEEGNDRLFGETGDDILDGSTGSDTLYGGAGFDTIIGSAGNDQLRGNFNADTFVFADGHGDDTILDFEADNVFEVIDLSGVSAITDLRDLIGNHMSQAGANVLIDTGGGNSIMLNGVNLADLDSSDFVF
jgi:Ca2+-binding RTX toxin-like protein